MKSMTFISYAQLAKDVEALCKTLNKPDLVVGIPRSGMLPATMMAKYWNTRVMTTYDFEKYYIHHHFKGLAYIVDDSMLCGQTMLKQMNKYVDTPLNLKYIVVYDSGSYPHRDGMISYYPFITIYGGRVFQWNLWNHNELLATTCMDIDGVLCRPPTEEENDDGHLYKKFLAETEQWYKPQHTVGCLVTARLVKYHKETVAWLNRHGIKFKNLVMLNMESKAERLSHSNIHARYKASAYENTNAFLFVEDEPGQAYAINYMTSRPVLCVKNWKLYNEVKNGQRKSKEHFDRIL